MAREPSQIADEFGVALVISRHGWSDLTLLMRRREVSCRVSGVFCDIVEVVVDLCDALIENRSCHAMLHDEPGGHRWTLTPIAAQQHAMLLQVFEFDKYFVEDEDRRTDLRLQAEFIIKRRQLATMLIGELWKTATLYEEPSYQRGRARFSTGDYHRLLERWQTWTSRQDGLPRSA